MIGWVDGSWSCRYAQVFIELAKVVQEFGHLEPGASAWQTASAKVANDSFSQRSFHHSMVTRSPNHMWASSCRMVAARDSYAASVTLERKTYWSRSVTAPAFSIAPALNSGTKSWSYLGKG